MKRLLFVVLLLLPIIFAGQATIARINLSGFNTNGVANFSFTRTAGALYIIFMVQSNAGGTPATAALTGTNQTWDEIGTAGGVVFNNKRLQAFRCVAPATEFISTTVTYTGTQDGGGFDVYEISNYDRSGSNGSGAIVQVVTATDNATIHPSITMAALLNRASVLAGFVNDVNLPGGTAEAGWTEYTEQGYNDPTTGWYPMKRQNTTDNTPSWTSAVFSNWAGMAIEIKAGGRRVIISN